jgi:hypothetical protein
LPDKSGKFSAAVLEIVEHVVAGTGGAEQDDVYKLKAVD